VHYGPQYPALDPVVQRHSMADAVRSGRVDCSQKLRAVGDCCSRERSDALPDYLAHSDEARLPLDWVRRAGSDFQAGARLHHDLPGHSDCQDEELPPRDVPHCLREDYFPVLPDGCSRPLQDDSPARQVGSLHRDDFLALQDDSALLRRPLPGHQHCRRAFVRVHRDSGFQPDLEVQHELFAPEAGPLSGSFQGQQADSSLLADE
jgi:hypothetical protein